MARKILSLFISINFCFCVALFLTSCKKETIHDKETGFKYYEKNKNSIVVTGFSNGEKIADVKSIKMDSIINGKTVVGISEGAFKGFESLESITLPFIGSSLFATEASKKTLFGYIFGKTSEGRQQYYASSKFIRYYIPSPLRSVTITGGNILYGGFSNCSFITSVTIGDGVKSIGEKAFYNCSNLLSVTIGDGVEIIGELAFIFCRELANVKIGNGVKSIESFAFYGCTLQTVVIGESVEKIDESVFYNMVALSDVYIQSPSIISRLSSYEACGYAIRYAVNLYIKVCDVPLGAGITENYTQISLERVDGVYYYVYMNNWRTNY